jgi:hypothetical protein
MNTGAAWGKLRPGMVADLVIVNGRPVQQIRDTHNVEYVIQPGAIAEPPKLKFDAAHDPGIRASPAVITTPRNNKARYQCRRHVDTSR